MTTPGTRLHVLPCFCYHEGQYAPLGGTRSSGANSKADPKLIPTGGGFARITREGVLRNNIVAVLRSRTFSLKINKLPIFFKITQA